MPGFTVMLYHELFSFLLQSLAAVEIKKPQSSVRRPKPAEPSFSLSKHNHLKSHTAVCTIVVILKQ